MSTKTKDPMPVRALAPWFGAGRLIAPLVGRELAGCKFVAVPFAGGMSEIAEIDARSIAVNDLHRHVVNLATVVAHPVWRSEMIRRLSRMPFHPDVLSQAQRHCKTSDPGALCDVDLAASYFVCCWMGRSHKAGGRDEFNGGISTRWNANGGDSNTRYRSALRGLVEWGRIMKRCSFTCLDAFEFLERCPDTKETGIYVDAPWPDDGAKYKHKFTEDDQRRLAIKLASFHQARVVVRFGDHPLIRQIYPEACDVCSGACSDPAFDCANCFNKNTSWWRWLPVTGRTQTNEAKREILLLNGPSRADGGMFQ